VSGELARLPELNAEELDELRIAVALLMTSLAEIRALATSHLVIEECVRRETILLSLSTALTEARLSLER
jgi:hypothetical protein